MEKDKTKKGKRLPEGKRKQREACVKVYDLTGASISRLEELNREKEMWRDLVGKLYVTMLERENELLDEVLEYQTKMNKTLKDLARRYNPKGFEEWEAETKANQVEPNLTK